MDAFLQGFAAGEISARCLHVHHLVNDGVVHGRGLGQQCRDDRDWDRHRVWLSERRYHRYHCIRNPGDQEACTDQHRHLGRDTSHPFVPLSRAHRLISLALLFTSPLPSQPTFVSLISRSWLFLMRASKWEISFAEDFTLKMIMT